MAIPSRPSPPASHPAPSAPRPAGTNATDISASSIPSSSDAGTHNRPRNIPRRSDRSVRNGIYLQSGIVVRSGVVDVRGRGFARKFLWSSKWLELWAEALSIRDNEYGPVSTTIGLQEVTEVERSDLKPYCLLLETKKERFHLAFKNEEELNSWQDDINSRKPLVCISNPTNFLHRVHLSVDLPMGMPNAKKLSIDQKKREVRGLSLQANSRTSTPVGTVLSGIRKLSLGSRPWIRSQDTVSQAICSDLGQGSTQATLPQNVALAGVVGPAPEVNTERAITTGDTADATPTNLPIYFPTSGTTDLQAYKLALHRPSTDRSHPPPPTALQTSPPQDYMPPSKVRLAGARGRGRREIEHEGNLKRKQVEEGKQPQIFPSKSSSTTSNPATSLRALHVPGSSPNEKPSVGGRTPPLTSSDPHDAAATPATESACGRLIRRVFAPHELSPLIDEALSKEDGTGSIRCLTAGDAQKLIDAIDEILNTHNLLHWVRKNCLRLLYRTCGHHARLPSALTVPISYDRTGDALYRGGYADVWKGTYHSQDVAVKVLRTYSSDELQKVINTFCKEVVAWRFLRHPNILPLLGILMSENRFAMVSKWMVNGNINQFVKAHPEVNRFGLLAGVAEGLIYLHDNEMVHGDLKGANILIDEAGHACLADFGLLTIISDPVNFLSSSSYSQGGTVRWMSPELIDPQKFGLEKSRRTISSDCYALGMVIYETISGNLPFHEHADLTVFVKVLGGERPTREAGFPKRLWRMLEKCWIYHPNNRPDVGDVLQRLQLVSKR